MSMSMNNSILSFREKLSYIEHSDKHKGVFKKIKAFCRLVVTCGKYDFCITRKECEKIVGSNNTCIFSRKIIELKKLSEWSELLSENEHFFKRKVDVNSLIKENKELRKALNISNEVLSDVISVTQECLNKNKSVNEELDKEKKVIKHKETTPESDKNNGEYSKDPMRLSNGITKSDKVGEYFIQQSSQVIVHKTCIDSSEVSDMVNEDCLDKLGGKYEQLYKVELINYQEKLIESMRGKKDDRHVVDFLLLIMTDACEDAFKRCSISINVVSKMTKVVDGEVKKNIYANVEVLTQYIQLISDAIKKQYKDFDESKDADGLFSTYVEKCAELAYMACMSSPPLKLSIPESESNKEVDFLPFTELSDSKKKEYNDNSGNIINSNSNSNSKMFFPILVHRVGKR